MSIVLGVAILRSWSSVLHLPIIPWSRQVSLIRAVVKQSKGKSKVRSQSHRIHPIRLAGLDVGTVAGADLIVQLAIRMLDCKVVLWYSTVHNWASTTQIDFPPSCVRRSRAMCSYWPSSRVYVSSLHIFLDMTCFPCYALALALASALRTRK